MNNSVQPLTMGVLLVAISLIGLGSIVAHAGGSSERLIPFTVQGVSMEPTLVNRQVVRVDRAAYRHHAVMRGDVILFSLAVIGQPQRRSVKRVIGLPGETVSVKRRRVYIDGKQLSEPYSHRLARYQFPSRRVPPRQYFVLGDNRNNSFDSTKWRGVWLSREDIIGEVLLPLKDAAGDRGRETKS